MESIFLWNQTENNPTSIFIDADYLFNNYKQQKKEYSKIHKQEFSMKIDISLLLNGIRTFTNLPHDNSLTIVLICKNQKYLEKHFYIRAELHLNYFQKERIHFIKSLDEMIQHLNQRLIFVADDRTYALLSEKYKVLNYPIMIFKKRVSKMPPNLPFQFIDYLSALTLGLSLEDL